MRRQSVSEASEDELFAFQTATRDLVGLALRSVERANLTIPQYRLLQVLADLGTVSSSRCAKALGVAGSSVTRLADRLHAAGHLVRGDDPDNRSVVTLSLTTAGRRAVRQVTAYRSKELAKALRGLDPDERAACVNVLAILHERMSDEAAHPLPV